MDHTINAKRSVGQADTDEQILNLGASRAQPWETEEPMCEASYLTVLKACHPLARLDSKRPIFASCAAERVGISP